MVDSPSSAGDSATRSIVGPSSTLESITACCGLSGMRLDKELLRRRLLMPQYLRRTMRDCIKKKDLDAGDLHFHTRSPDDVFTPESPMVVFINSRSGGRHGPALKHRLQELISEEQVFDLSEVKPNEFVQYGLGSLKKLVALGDTCAQETCQKMRIVVAGGDGTVGWVLGCLGDLHEKAEEHVPPVAIIPLGTGNDLSRSFGWGGTFPFAWKSAIKRTLLTASTGQTGRLDSWRVVMQMPYEEIVKPPYCLKHSENCSLDQDLAIQKVPEKVSSYEGVFYNYFSIGMDAKVAYGFHHLRNEKPYLAQGPISNKIIYSSYSCTQGWFLTPCVSSPSLRGLKNILRLYIKKVNCSEWEQVPVPKSVRSIVALNLHSYGSGRHPWGNLKPKYLEKRGFVEAHADDGLLEIFGLKQGWHASFVMVELITAKHIAQAAAIRFELRGAAWKNAYLQMDGEPWKQPMSSEDSTFVEIKRMPYQSQLVLGE